MKHFYKTFEFSRLVCKRGGPESSEFSELVSSFKKDDIHQSADDFRDMGTELINGSIDLLNKMGGIPDGKAERLKRRASRKLDRKIRRQARQGLREERRELKKSYKSAPEQVEQKTQDLLSKLESKIRNLITESEGHEDMNSLLTSEIMRGSLKDDLAQIYDLRGDYYPIEFNMIVDGSQLYEISCARNAVHVSNQNIGEKVETFRNIEAAFSRLNDMEHVARGVLKKFERSKDNPSLIRSEILSAIKAEPSFEKNFNLVKQIFEIQGFNKSDLTYYELRLGSFKYTPFISPQGEYDIRVEY